MFSEVLDGVFKISVRGRDKEELLEISKVMNLGLDIEEMTRIRDYFSEIGRDPYDVELYGLAQAWSEHCSYKSSKRFLRKYLLSIGEVFLREDSGLREFDSEYYYVAAMESHNHPSAVEPYGGAATGVGGIIRDVLCMGAEPIALVDVLFFGPLDEPRNSYLHAMVVKGISDYGNRVGIPTVSGSIKFHESYSDYCLVNVGCIGLVEKSNVVRSRFGSPGDVILLVGGRTGADGIMGVSFASKELSEEREKERSAVQIGDPITKEPLIHAILEVRKLISGMKDLGGGGLAVAIGEMSYSAGLGAEVHLDKVHLRQKLRPWEIWISESQERMLLSVPRENLEKVRESLDFWEIEYSEIGSVTGERKVRAYYMGEKVFEIDTDFFVGALERSRPYVIEEREEKDMGVELGDIREDLLRILASPNVSSQEKVIRQYDYDVKGNTVIKPLQGRIESPGPGDASVIKAPHSWRGIALTSDVNPYYMELNPYWGAASAAEESVRNLISVNSKPDSLLDCLNFGNPEKKERMGEFVSSLKGLRLVAMEFGTPFISGNVSFYNETKRGGVVPTPAVIGIGIVEDVRKCVTMDLKSTKSYLILIGETKREMGGSQYYILKKKKYGIVPRVNPRETKRKAETILKMMNSGLILSCHDLSEGGLGVSLCEMALAGGIGFEVKIPNSYREDYVLFSESNGRWIIEVEKKNLDVVLDKISGIDHYLIGRTKKGEKLSFISDSLDLEIDLEEVEMAWRGNLKEVM